WWWGLILPLRCLICCPTAWPLWDLILRLRSEAPVTYIRRSASWVPRICLSRSALAAASKRLSKPLSGPTREPCQPLESPIATRPPSGVSAMPIGSHPSPTPHSMLLMWRPWQQSMLSWLPARTSSRPGHWPGRKRGKQNPSREPVGSTRKSQTGHQHQARSTTRVANKRHETAKSDGGRTSGSAPPGSVGRSSAYNLSRDRWGLCTARSGPERVQGRGARNGDRPRQCCGGGSQDYCDQQSHW